MRKYCLTKAKYYVIIQRRGDNLCLNVISRDENIKEIINALEILKHNIPTQSIIYSGVNRVQIVALMKQVYAIAQKVKYLLQIYQNQQKR